MLKFNPFSVAFDEVQEEHLNELISNSIAEGWFIEFKSNFTDSEKLAKSISSFANSQGGWYFIGIQSNSKNNIAENISGLEIKKDENLIDRINNQLTGNISPKPYFDIKIVELHSKKCVIIVRVEEGIEPPYVTGSGKIYQRENNSSNPISDRYVLEKLYEKSAFNNNKVERFTRIDYAETKGQGESDQAYLEMYLFPTPFDSFVFKDFFESSFFKAVSIPFFQGLNLSFQDKDIELNSNIGIGFNSIYTSYDSLVIRPIIDDEIIYKGTTIELFRNGNMKVLISLYRFKLYSAPNYYSDSNFLKYLLTRFDLNNDNFSEQHTDIQDILFNQSNSSRDRSNFSNHFNLIDGHELILILAFIVIAYQKIIEENGYQSAQLGFRARFDNCWRNLIFLENEEYLEEVKKYNIPTPPKSDIEIPKFIDGKYFKFPNEKFLFLQIFQHLLEGIGMPRSKNFDYSSIFKTSLEMLNRKK